MSLLQVAGAQPLDEEEIVPDPEEAPPREEVNGGTGTMQLDEEDHWDPDE